MCDDRQSLILFGVATSACFSCLAFFKYTRAGSAVRAVIQQRDAAALVGVDIDRLNILVFALGFALAALAGVLVSMVQEITPFVGFPFTIFAFVIITLGASAICLARCWARCCSPPSKCTERP